MNRVEQYLVEQALEVGEVMNDAALNMPSKPTARIQFIAHCVMALALADANHIPLQEVQTTIREMYREMVRTRRERKPPKRKPTLVLIDKKESPRD